MPLPVSNGSLIAAASIPSCITPPRRSCGGVCVQRFADAVHVSSPHACSVNPAEEQMITLLFSSVQPLPLTNADLSSSGLQLVVELLLFQTLQQLFLSPNPETRFRLSPKHHTQSIELVLLGGVCL